MVLNGFAVFVRNFNGQFVRVFNPPVEVFEDDAVVSNMLDPYIDVVEVFVGSKVFRVVRLDIVREAVYVLDPKVNSEEE